MSKNFRELSSRQKSRRLQAYERQSIAYNLDDRSAVNIKINVEHQEIEYHIDRPTSYNLQLQDMNTPLISSEDSNSNGFDVISTIDVSNFKCDVIDEPKNKANSGENVSENPELLKWLCLWKTKQHYTRCFDRPVKQIAYMWTQ